MVAKKNYFCILKDDKTSYRINSDFLLTIPNIKT